jgi:hypothetical protein
MRRHGQHSRLGVNMKSTCTSGKHSEYSCMIKWSVTKLKFDSAKWCEACRIKYGKDQ